jgi:hypothetical protein
MLVNWEVMTKYVTRNGILLLIALEFGTKVRRLCSF